MARTKREKEGLNEEQQKVFASFRAGANIFLCGKGGTGKSFLTRYIIDYCDKSNKATLVCAPTGIAALNIGGSTIHRAFGVPTSIVEKDKRCHNSKKLDVISKADVIIIDEISMCRIDVFEYIAKTLLYLKPRKQLLVVGDFYQLPPVLRNEDGEVFNHIWGKKLYAFESELWQKLQLQTMELTTVMRQTDRAFVAALDNIREGIPDFSLLSADKPADPTAITILGTNSEADQINQRQIKQLVKNGARLVKFEAVVNGSVDSSEFPTDKILSICVGARVVVLRNDTKGDYVNGSMATVVDCNENSLQLRVDGKTGIVTIERNKWTFVDYEVRKTDAGTKLTTIERGTFEQFPVRLAWAITIHKSQGQTYDNVNVDVSNIFAEGQLYVALSRCRSLEGMRIIGSLTAEKAKTADIVKRFMQGNYAPSETGPMLPFYDEETESPSDERYQEGYDDGYEDGTNDTTARYEQMVKNDPGVKVLSDYTRRQHELAQISDPDVRNPRGAGRKKKEYNEKVASKSIRVLGELADSMKALNEEAKKAPERLDFIKQLLLHALEEAQVK